MKKLVALMLALSLVLCSIPALAAGKLSVQQENFHVIKDYRLYGYVYAKVSNVGDRPIKVNTGLLEIFNADGDALTSTDSFSAYAKYLQPGEYTYMKLYDEIENAESSDVDDYMLTVTGKSSNDYISKRLPCVSAYEPDIKDGHYTRNYMYATVTNDTDEPIYAINIVMALLDAEGNILYIASDNLYDSRALMPGSSLMFRCDVDSDHIKYMQENGYVPVEVDAIAYVTVER